jgi:hypothetical protein
MTKKKHEVLQEISGVHARQGESTTCGWFQKAQKDIEEV